jgi:hypothetical protein
LKEKRFGDGARSERTNHSLGEEILFAPSLYGERVLELCQDAFVPVYERVGRRYWNNGIYADVKHPYYMANHDLGLGEYYVPTVLNGENIIQTHRIVVSVQPELDTESFEREVQRLAKPLRTPLGKIDSETLFIIAPKISEKQRSRLRRLGKKAYIRNRRFGYRFATPIITESPEIAVKKLMERLTHFWQKRVKAFLERVKLQAWMYDYKVKNLLSNTILVLEEYDSNIKHSLRSMVAHLLFFEERLREAFRGIGRLNGLKMRVFAVSERISSMLSLLDEHDKRKVLAKLEECLALSCVGRG